MVNTFMELQFFAFQDAYIHSDIGYKIEIHDLVTSEGVSSTFDSQMRSQNCKFNLNNIVVKKE
jgi:hypothetical protein